MFELAGRLPDGEPASALDAWVRSATARAVLELGAAARAAFAGALAQGLVLVHQPVDEQLFAQLVREHPVAVCCVLSTHRSGYVREPALRYLTQARQPRVVPFLLLRTDDIVLALRELATDAVEARFQAPFAPAFVRSLRIVEVLRGRSRSGAQLVRRVEEFLVRPECDAALTQPDDDPVVRKAAFTLRLRTRPAEVVLAAALADPDLRVRTWAARTAASRLTTPAAKQILLPQLDASRSAQVRRLGLRMHRELGSSDAPFEAALFDPQAIVRLDARAELRSRHPERPFGLVRARALELLDDAQTEAARLIGALGVLSDLGHAEDRPVVTRFLGDRRARVRAEAARTQALLTAH